MALNMITAFYWLVIMLMGTVDGFWKMRFQRPIGSARIDPIVDPGMVSGHVHTFFGGRSEYTELKIRFAAGRRLTSSRHRVQLYL